MKCDQQWPGPPSAWSWDNFNLNVTSCEAGVAMLWCPAAHSLYLLCSSECHPPSRVQWRQTHADTIRVRSELVRAGHRGGMTSCSADTLWSVVARNNIIIKIYPTLFLFLGLTYLSVDRDSCLLNATKRWLWYDSDCYNCRWWYNWYNISVWLWEWGHIYNTVCHHICKSTWEPVNTNCFNFLLKLPMI